jgi:hypothetical protein
MRAVDLATASILILLGGVVVADSLRIGIGWGTARAAASSRSGSASS